MGDTFSENMSDTFKWNKRQGITAVVLGVVLPYGLLMSRFSLRNDQIEYFLPARVYMRDAFRHHEFMLWNPFLSGSYPIHCDMQASVWNPITFVLTYLFDYNAWWLSFELMLYYVIGAIGAFYFARHFSRNYVTCAVIGMIYGCGGFGVSILEFMSWAGSFAYLPWAAYFFYRLLRKPDLFSSIGMGVALWLMLVSGYPSFFIYLGYCLVGLAAAYLAKLHRDERDKRISGVIWFGLLGLLFFVLLSLPAIRSFYEYLPFYTRGKHAADEHLNGEFFAWNYPISLIFPAAGTLVWDNDLYIGLIPVLLLVAGTGEQGMGRGGRPVWRGWHYRDWVLAAGFVFTLLFTLGRSTPVRMWSARYLPLLNAFGFSHSVGVFLVMAAFVWLAPRLDRVFDGYETGAAEEVRRLGRVRAVGLAMAGLLVIVWVMGYPGVRAMSGTIRLMYLVSGVWQLALLVVLGCSAALLTTGRRLFLFVAMDLVGSILTVAPLTGFTVTSPARYDRSVAAFYRSDAGEFLSDTTGKVDRIRQRNRKKDVNVMKIVGRNNFPSHTQSDTFFNYVLDKERYDGMLAKPFVFAADSTPLDIRELRLEYNRIGAVVEAQRDCDLVIQQTYYHRWRSDQPEYQPFVYKGVFMAVRLRKGINRIMLYYDSEDLWVAWIISAATLLVLAGIVWFQRGDSKKRV